MNMTLGLGAGLIAAILMGGLYFVNSFRAQSSIKMVVSPSPFMQGAPGSATSPATLVNPAQLPTSAPLNSPQAVPIGLPISEKDYEKLKEEAAKKVLPTSNPNQQADQ